MPRFFRLGRRVLVCFLLRVRGLSPPSLPGPACFLGAPGLGPPPLRGRAAAPSRCFGLGWLAGCAFPPGRSSRGALSPLVGLLGGFSLLLALLVGCLSDSRGRGSSRACFFLWWLCLFEPRLGGCQPRRDSASSYLPCVCVLVDLAWSFEVFSGWPPVFFLSAPQTSPA